MRFITPLALGVCLLTAACGGGSSALHDNERILNSLPEVPGAQRLDVHSEPYYHCDDIIIRPVRGYYTNVTYQAPEGTTAQQVVDFYVERLKGDWQYRREYIGIAAPLPGPPPTPGGPPTSAPQAPVLEPPPTPGGTPASGPRPPVPETPPTPAGQPASAPGPLPTPNVLGEIPVAYFEREHATVGVSTDNMATREIARASPSEHLTEPRPGPDFTISVDSRGTIERPYCD